MSLSQRTVRRNQSILKQTYQMLRTAILSGELVPGQRLVETQVAEQLQISRTPVREALRLLQHDNLAIIDQRGAVRVATISTTAAAQLYDCRIALEELSIRGACQNATYARLQELELMIRQAEKLQRSDSSFLTNYRLLDLDYRFHRLLAESSGNPWLVNLLDQIFDKMLLVRIQTIKRNPNVLEIRLEHHQIYEALVQRDVDPAVRAIREHLTASKQRVMRELQPLEPNIDTVQ